MFSDLKIKDLELPVGIERNLARHHIATVAALLSLVEDGMYWIRGIGKKKTDIIRTALVAHGIDLPKKSSNVSAVIDVEQYVFIELEHGKQSIVITPAEIAKNLSENDVICIRSENGAMTNRVVSYVIKDHNGLKDGFVIIGLQ